MGIYYRLFQHPFLVLPVIYHEQLHYAGPRAVPGQGLDNEAEVLIREILFARSLIAGFAPSADGDIPAFERSLVKQVCSLQLEYLLAQLLFPVEEASRLDELNRSVEKTYDRRLSTPEAVQKAEESVRRQNFLINISNDEQTWCPEKKWPMLDTGETYDITRRYRQILIQRWTYNNHLSADDHKRIFEDPDCTRWLQNWNEYLKRPGAKTELAIPPQAKEDWLSRLLGFDLPGKDDLDLAENLHLLEKIRELKELEEKLRRLRSQGDLDKDR